MNKRKIVIWLAAILLFQGAIYLYLDQVLFAPASAFQVTAAETVTSGKAYYSMKRQYMAVVKAGVVEIFSPDNKLLRSLPLGDQKVTYFKWLDDRNLALMALQQDVPGGSKATLTRINPMAEGQELSADIEKLPLGSAIIDVAFSTATNAIYMQVHVGKGPDTYQIYRTDANHNLQRAFLTTTRLARIATLFDIDYLIYDNLPDNTVIARYTDGSWLVISPIGKYRLVGTVGNDVYIARVNNDGLAIAILKGTFIKAGVKPNFAEYRTLSGPTDVHQLVAAELAKPLP
ncbi:MAG: hypothetical protein P4N41_09565 [Negativicutes bacterium]|nr:hypothetical protein [Negativicutes bacterium]MDR3589892.1 hypothetical protein [Negativicutes bacterium]